MPGPLTVDDLRLMARTFYGNTWANMPAAIAANPRLSELASAAKASGLDFDQILRSVPVNRSGNVLASANDFVSRYSSRLTPATQAKPTVMPTATATPSTPATPPKTPTPTLAAATPIQGVSNEAQIGAIAWDWFKNHNWNQIEAASNTDPFLKQLRAYSGSIGADWKTVLTQAATSGIGYAPGLKNYLLSQGQYTNAEADRARQTQELVKAASAQQTLAPTGPSQYSIGETTPHAPVSPTGVPQSTLTGQPTIPVNTPAAAQITDSDRAISGVKVVEGGNAMVNTPSPSPAAPAEPAAPAARVGLESGLNAFNPQLVQSQFEDLQLARLPVGELVRQEQNRLNALTNTPKPDKFALEQERLNSPFKIRQSALDMYRAGKLKPL